MSILPTAILHRYFDLFIFIHRQPTHIILYHRVHESHNLPMYYCNHLKYRYCGVPPNTLAAQMRHHHLRLEHAVHRCVVIPGQVRYSKSITTCII